MIFPPQADGLSRSAKLAVAFVALVLATPTFSAESTAQLQWVRTVALSTPVSGVIADVAVAKGERVQAGQILLRLEDSAQKARFTASEAQLVRAENNRAEGEREYNRAKELYDQTLLSDHDLQLASIARDAAQSELLSAKAARVQAERDLYNSSIRAPFDAWVLQRNAEPGQTVVSELQATPLIVLAEAGRMLARTMVSGEMAGKLKVGQKASVTVAGKDFTGKVHFVALEPVKATDDHYVVEVIFTTQAEPLRVGQQAKVKF